MEYQFDIAKLEEDVTKVLQYSQGLHGVELYGVKEMLQKWLASKKLFIEHMDGKLIYQTEEPLSFELDEKAKLDKKERFADFIEEHYENWALSNFIHCLPIEDFYNNKTSTEYRNKFEESIIVPANFKVVKAFKFFIDNEDLLKQVQSEASRIIQENVISGYLCFSVHPLDYLSISENIHNWRSCHALDGDYRSGNLNYMLDSSTVVCYLRADKQAVLPHFPEDVLWNSKKWRVLFFFSNDTTMVFAGRQYPFVANKGIDIIKDKILPVLRFGNWTSWHSTRINSYKDKLSGEEFFFERMIPVGTTLKDFKNVVVNGRDTYQFNDLLLSSFYTPMWAYRKRSSSYYLWDAGGGTGCSDENTFFVIGEACPCPVCDCKNVSFPSVMLCRDCAEEYNQCCEDYYECELCGTMVFSDDMYDLEYSGLRVCQHCYDNETYRCQECGNRDVPDVIKHHNGDARCLCPTCWEDSQRPKRSSKLYF